MVSKTKTATRAVEAAETNLRIAEDAEREAAARVEKVRHEAAALRTRDLVPEHVAAHQTRYGEAGVRLDAAREATRQAAAALRDANSRADEQAGDDPEDPATFKWIHGERLASVRDEQVAAERRLADLENAEIDRQQAVDAAREHRRRTRALLAVGGATPADVAKAEAAVVAVERKQDEHLGETLILKERIVALREQARVETLAVRGRLKQRGRREYAQSIMRIAEILQEAQREAVRSERIFWNVEENFSVRSNAAETHGTNAGIGSLPLAPRWLLPGSRTDGVPGVGGLGYWLSEVADLFRRNGLDREAK